ncbi:ion channel [Maricaulis sp. CAU 1757]
MLDALMLSAGLALATVLVHLAGLEALIALLRRIRLPARRRGPLGWLRQGLAILGVLIGLFLLHGVEMWIYAWAYYGLGEFPDMETALYYSVSTFTTLGQGDVVLQPPWRLVGALEAFVGFLMLGWSTAFLVALIGRMRALEVEIEGGVE